MVCICNLRIPIVEWEVHEPDSLVYTAWQKQDNSCLPEERQCDSMQPTGRGGRKKGGKENGRKGEDQKDGKKERKNE